MNIALLTSGPLSNTKEATWLTLFSLAQEYQRQGHYVVICSERKEGFAAVEIVDNVKVYRIFRGSYGRKWLLGYRTLRYIKKKEGMTFDVVHGFSSSPMMVLNTLFATRAAPLARKIHTLKSDSKYFFGRLKLPLFFLKKVDVVTVPLKLMAERLMQHGLSSTKLKVVHSNISCSRFKPGDKIVLKKKYGFEGKKLVLYYGALRWEKGVDDLLKVVPVVKEKIKNCFFLFAVRSKVFAKKEKYMALVKELKCENDVLITLDDLPIEDYVAMADVIVLAYPTLIGTEANPSCLLEAMASKTAVVTTDFPELREIVQPEKEVLMVIPGNVDSLSHEIVRALSDDLLRKKLVENAFVVAQRFDTSVIAKQFLDIYSL